MAETDTKLNEAGVESLSNYQFPVSSTSTLSQSQFSLADTLEEPVENSEAIRMKWMDAPRTWQKLPPKIIETEGLKRETIGSRVQVTNTLKLAPIVTRYTCEMERRVHRSMWRPAAWHHLLPETLQAALVHSPNETDEPLSTMRPFISFQSRKVHDQALFADASLNQDILYSIRHDNTSMPNIAMKRELRKTTAATRAARQQVDTLAATWRTRSPSWIASMARPANVLQQLVDEAMITRRKEAKKQEPFKPTAKVPQPLSKTAFRCTVTKRGP